MIRSIRVIRVQTLSFAALHAEGAEDGCVGVSLIVAMVISSMIGTVIPMFFHKIHIDPAVASGPLITTVNDLVAVVTYYGLAMVFLVNIFQIAG